MLKTSLSQNAPVWLLYNIAYLSIFAIVRYNYFTNPLKAQTWTVTEIFLLTSNNAQRETKDLHAPTAATVNDETLSTAAECILLWKWGRWWNDDLNWCALSGAIIPFCYPAPDTEEWSIEILCGMAHKHTHRYTKYMHTDVHILYMNIIKWQRSIHSLPCLNPGLGSGVSRWRGRGSFLESHPEILCGILLYM